MAVCKMNQARSPFAQSALAKHFPDIVVTSGGVEAIAGTPYLPNVVSTARHWGLEMPVGYSKALKGHPDLPKCDLVICAEEYMLGSTGLSEFRGRATAYEDVAPDSSFMPRDPAGLRGRYMESELAKVATLSIWALRDFLKIKTAHPITAVVPEGESTTNAALDWAIAECSRNGGLLIDADLRAPLISEFRQRELHVGNLLTNHPFDNFAALSIMSEQLRPEKLFLDSWWKDTITEIAKTRPVIMITAPQMINSGPLPDPYLAAIAATEIHIVRR